MTPRFWFRRVALVFLPVLAFVSGPLLAATVSGDGAKWFPITLDFVGPQAAETDNSPNPFLDYRLNVTLTAPSGRQTEVPGFFDGDGQGNGTGSVWRVRFSANEVGVWQYRASFRQGDNVAISLEDNVGTAATIGGATGSFSVLNRRDNAPGFLSKGRLNYIGGHYLKFADGGYWLKGGTDSPENLLGFEGIDGTSSAGGIEPNFLHDFDNHVSDFTNGDPLFENSSNGSDSRGLIGALNYLSARGVNSVYFLTNNLGGDGQDTYPFVGSANTTFNKTHYDISKLHQWNQVFNHAQEKSIFLHMVLTETERANERWLDDGALGIERKLYIRELIARFGYVMAGKWNLGEENDFPVTELRAQARYIDALDWSEKPITVHTQINDFTDYDVIVGDPLFSATSIQYDPQFAGDFVERWRKASANAGHPWVLDMDENTGGIAPSNVNNRRKQMLYDVYFSGGQIEWYFGYHPLPLGGDVTAGDFTLREQVWDDMRYARRFMERELPFWEMEPSDNLITGEANLFGGAEVLAKNGDIYAIYLPQASQTGRLNLSGVDGSFTLRWFNPRTGEFQGASRNLNGGSNQALGNAPADQNNDWVALVKRDGYRYSQPGPSTDPTVVPIATASLEPVSAPDINEVNVATVEAASEANDVTTGEASNETAPTATTEATTSAAPEFLNVVLPPAIAGQMMSFSVVAIDPDGVAPSITVEQDLPPGMRINGSGGGVLNFDWLIPTDRTDPVSVEVLAIDAITPAVRTTLSLVITTTTSDDDANLAADDDANLVASDDVNFATGDDVNLAVSDDVNLSASSTANQTPLLVAITDLTVMVGEHVDVIVAAIDPDGFVPAIWSNNLPDGASLDDNGNGTRALRWNPAPEQIGRHVIELQVADAIDPSIQLTHQWTLEVIDQTVDTAPLFQPVEEPEPGNRGPIFPPVIDQVATAGQTFTLLVRPIDPEGGAPDLLLITDLENASFDDVGNGGRELRWIPTEAEMGSISLEFIAIDSTNPELHSQLAVTVDVSGR